ncbi:hypothetical protein LTSESEN_4741 [Salmonella enterica subsp. enterica serovar Senftenberg str. A4-543]|uniref:Uncharacterized protein n=1 Tax=Salmonella enterica subsp. enterica serovar Senftenberg str. A4-543 TaxID=913082 RepID=G5R551_SALSE|nr:hypothetical protein LTSESEN_4741 [Salmonella enterica subsp. enterica serovar Senftenberg str. A4-543]
MFFLPRENEVLGYCNVFLALFYGNLSNLERDREYLSNLERDRSRNKRLGINMFIRFGYRLAKRSIRSQWAI